MRLLSLCLLFICISINFAKATEFIIKPKNMEIQPGENLVVQIYSTNIFLKEGNAELPPLVQLGVLQESSALTIDLKENREGTLLQGNIALMTGGPGLLIGKVLPRVWSDSPEAGMAEGDRMLLAEYGLTSTKTLKVEKFAKTLMNSQANDQLFKTQVGHKLEIVILNNPAEIKIGDKINFQVFLNKKPVQLPVYFTYNGYSDIKNKYYAKLRTNKKGKGSAIVTKAGLWKLSTSLERIFEKKIEKKTKKNVDKNVEKSVEKNTKQKHTFGAKSDREKIKQKDTDPDEMPKTDMQKEKTSDVNEVTLNNKQSSYSASNSSEELTIDISKNNTQKESTIQNSKSETKVDPKAKETALAKTEPSEPKQIMTVPTLAEKETIEQEHFLNRKKKAQEIAKGKPAIDGQLLKANYVFEIK